MYRAYQNWGQGPTTHRDLFLSRFSHDGNRGQGPITLGIMFLTRFSHFLAPLAKGQRCLCYGSWSVVRASVNSFLVGAIETTFLNQSGPNLHEVFMATRSQMSSIMSEICPVTPELMPLKYWKLAVLDLVSTIETTFLNQSGPKLHQSIYRHKISDEFDNEQNQPSNTEVICPWIIENCCFEPC